MKKSKGLQISASLTLPLEAITETIAVLGIRGSGKALSLDTPLATTAGWTTMGTVVVGDVLFDERGEPCRVVYVAPIQEGNECFEVVFDDNSIIVADAEHLWLSETSASRRSDCLTAARRERGVGPGTRPQNQRRSFPQIVTTRQLSETLHVVGDTRGRLDRNHSVRNAVSLVMPERDLPIDPYVLGAWLGDGHSQSSYITNADRAVFDQICSAGYSLGEPLANTNTGKASTRRIGSRGGVPMHKSLRLLGLLHNKHVPICYLRASTSQRLALLQGLMDTDGWVSATTSSCEITSSRPQLADGILELIVSLGWKVTSRIRVPKCSNGNDGRPSCRMLFRPSANVFRLPRKANRLRFDLQQKSRTRRRMVVDVRPIASVPVRCIAVDSPKNLFLAGRQMVPTHNTNTCVVLTEELLDAGQQVVVIDPTDVWHGLRSSKDGKSAGYPIVVFGGRHGDVPLAAGDGATVADFIVEERVPAILSLRHFESQSDQRRFVTDFARRLYHRKGEEGRDTPMLLAIDEAHLFVPQRVTGAEAQMVGAIQKLVRQGRTSGIGVAIIDQRAASVNKDVLTQLELLICHRTSSPQDRKALEGWIEQHDKNDQKGEFLKRLPELARGVAWCWSPGWLDIFKEVPIRARHTFDSSATPKAGEVRITPTTLAKVDLDALKTRMAAAIEKAKHDDPKALRVELERVKKQLVDAQRGRVQAAPPEPPIRVEVPVLTKKHEEMFTAFAEALRTAKESNDAVLVKVERVIQANAELKERLNTFTVSPIALRMARSAALGKMTAITEGRGIPRIADDGNRRGNIHLSKVPPREPEMSSSSDTKLGSGERKCMRAIAQHPNGVSRKQLTTLTGYKRSTRNAYVQRLERAGFAVLVGEQITKTKEGLDWLGSDYEALPTGDALRTYWMESNRLPVGEKKILEVLCDEYPSAVSRERLSESTGFKRSTRNAYIQRLVARELVQEIDRDHVIAVDALFDEE